MPRKKPRRRWIALPVLLLLLAASYAAVQWVLLPSAEPLANKDPPSTALIDHRAEEARARGEKPRRRQHWVGLDHIAPSAVAAVLISEDASFYQHDGVDYVELRKALEESAREGHLGRGASTITQQLAKNLWLSGDRSLIRKAKELVLARRLEDALTKKRILVLYLNVAEWGDGIYGIDAAAHEHFGVSADALTPGQGAILAAMLPSPRKWTPARRPRVLLERSLRIIDRLESVGRLTPAEADLARAEIQGRLG